MAHLGSGWRTGDLIESQWTEAAVPAPQRSVIPESISDRRKNSRRLPPAKFPNPCLGGFHARRIQFPVPKNISVPFPFSPLDRHSLGFSERSVHMGIARDQAGSVRKIKRGQSVHMGIAGRLSDDFPLRHFSASDGGPSDAEGESRPSRRCNERKAMARLSTSPTVFGTYEGLIPAAYFPIRRS